MVFLIMTTCSFVHVTNVSVENLLRPYSENEGSRFFRKADLILYLNCGLFDYDNMQFCSCHERLGGEPAASVF
jgi:hypothetical protein